MKKKVLLIATAVIALGAMAFRTLADDWTIDTTQAKVSFELPDEGTKGTIGGLAASIHFNPLSLGDAKIEASVDVATLNTGVEGKDHHLKTADFFDAEKFPKIKFTTDKVTATDKGFLATGKLMMKDSVKTIDIPFNFESKGDNEGVFKGTMEVFAGDYGIMKKSKTGKDKVVITIEVPVKK